MLITRVRARDAHLLETSQGSYEFLNQPEVRAQPPEQENQQQDHEGDNYQILQITSADVRRIIKVDEFSLAIVTTTIARTSGVR